MSSASDSLDPIELAQGEISRSKDVVASVSKDLDQHDRWLKDFVASEKLSRARHARWVKRQQAKERRRLARQRLARSARRGTLSVAVFIRSVFWSLWKGVAYLGHLIWQSAAWIALSTYALSAFLLKQLSSGISWISARDSRRCARIAKSSFGRLLVGRRPHEGADDRLVQAVGDGLFLGARQGARSRSRLPPGCFDQFIVGLG